MHSPLKSVRLQADIYMACLYHALSTEAFEVMGLLIGDNIDGITTISASIILRRSDKKKDRVEISSEQLMKASEEAEKLTQECNTPMRVVGWYHSHPHITVWPSAVDINTQAMYQTMDRSFIGLIFSVFAEDKTTNEQQVFLTCFQSNNGTYKEIPMSIDYVPSLSPVTGKILAELPKILTQEEEDIAVEATSYLISIHNNAVKIRALGQISDIVSRPLLHSLHERYEACAVQEEYLSKQLKDLEGELENLELDEEL